MKAFEPYYEATLEEATDPHKLYELQDKILDYHVFDESEVDEFVHAYLRGDSQAVLHNILSPVKDEFVKVDKEDQVGLRRF